VFVRLPHATEFNGVGLGTGNAERLLVLTFPFSLFSFLFSFPLSPFSVILPADAAIHRGAAATRLPHFVFLEGFTGATSRLE
jgi:hypothetical protein